MSDKSLREYDINTTRLASIIRPVRRSRYEMDCEVRKIMPALLRMSEDYGPLEMCPDFQRGHVWSSEKQQHFVENMLRGTLSSGMLLVQFNIPNFETDELGDLPNGLQCIDGLQRITAINQFLDGHIKPFGLTFEDLDNSRFSLRGVGYCFKVAIYDFKFKRDLLTHYLDFNAGGVVHSQEEIDRVTAMRDACGTPGIDEDQPMPR